MDTQTLLVCTASQARQFCTDLFNAAKKAEKDGTLTWARAIFEQGDSEGPWRLCIGVGPDNKENEEE